MVIHNSESHESFRRELLGWLAESLAAHGPLPSDDDREVRRKYDIGGTRKLDETGYAGITRSHQYRSRGAPLFEQLACDKEIARPVRENTFGPVEEYSEAIENIIDESPLGQFHGG